MNQWQKYYCDVYYNGKMPRSQKGKKDFELLGQIGSQVTVEFPEQENKPAHTETFVVTENVCNIPQGKISITVLCSNLNLWLFRGQKITTDGGKSVC